MASLHEQHYVAGNFGADTILVIKVGDTCQGGLFTPFLQSGVKREACILSKSELYSHKLIDPKVSDDVLAALVTYFRLKLMSNWCFSELKSVDYAIQQTVESKHENTRKRKVRNVIEELIKKCEVFDAEDEMVVKEMQKILFQNVEPLIKLLEKKIRT